MSTFVSTQYGLHSSYLIQKVPKLGYHFIDFPSYTGFRLHKMANKYTKSTFGVSNIKIANMRRANIKVGDREHYWCSEPRHSGFEVLTFHTAFQFSPVTVNRRWRRDFFFCIRIFILLLQTSTPLNVVFHI